MWYYIPKVNAHQTRCARSLKNGYKEDINMRKRITSLFLVLALCLAMMPTAALAETVDFAAQTPPAVEEAADPANGEAKQENQPETLANEDLPSHTTHDNGWTPISTADKLNGITEAGNYYLTGEVTLTKAWKPADGVVLCLNGYSITANANVETIIVESDRTFTLTDCKREGKEGKITHGFNNKTNKTHYYFGVWVSGTFNMYGGSITGNNQSGKAVAGGGVYVGEGGIFNMYGGKITDNISSSGGGVGVSGTFNMYGGTISGNTADGTETHGGGGVSVGSSSTFTMNGGTISGNTAVSNGGGVRVCYGGTFTMNDGTIGGTTDEEANEAEYNGGGVYVCSGNSGNTSSSKFTMNGGTITGNKAKNGGGVYMAYVDSTFTMEGGTISDNKAKNGGGGVCVNKGTFTMKGGSITGNTATSTFGGGVYVSDGTFTMNDSASITSNTASSGGGVCVGDGTFTMNGGTISGNTVTNCGGGVTITGKSGKFTVSGTVTITGNKEGTTENNVYLTEDKITIGEDGLTQDARIGISTLGGQLQFATGANNDALDYARIFIPEATKQGYVVIRDTDGNLYLTEHQHNWTYALKEGTTDTIIATCDAADCPITDGVSVTINKPAHTTYGDGKAAAATVTGSIPGVTTPTITYKKGNETLESAPTNAGTYTASIELGGVTASVEYTIAKATPTIRSWQGYPYGKIFNGTQLANPASNRLTITGGTYSDIAAFNWYTATKEGGSYTKGAKLNENPTDAGDYIIEAVFKETDTTNAATSELGLTIQKARYDGAVSAAVNMHPSPNPQTVTVDLSEELTKNQVRHGGSLALDAFGISSQSTFVDLDNTKLNGNILTITMKPMASNLIGMQAIVNVNVTSRNYEVIPVQITLTLQEKPTANDIHVSIPGWTYGETANAPVYTVPEGVTATVTYAKADGTVLSEQPTDAGDYTVKVQYETDTEIHTGTADFTINPKNLQQKMLAKITGDRNYNGTKQTPNVTVTDGEKTLQKDVDYTVSYSNNTNASTPTSQAIATVTGKGNYTGIISTTFVINPARLIIIGEDPLTATASYGTKVKDIPVSSTRVYYDDGEGGKTEVSGTWEFDGDGMDDIPEVGNTKEYKAVFTPTSGGENFCECFIHITPSISQAAGAVTNPAAKADLVYNGKEQALLETLPSSSTGTVQYSLDGTKYTEIQPTGKNAGTYTVFYKVVGDKNHLDVEAQSIQVEIKKLAITVTAENKTSRVGQALAELTYTYAPKLAAGDTFTGTLETDARLDTAGSYSITQGNLALNENYTIDFRPGTYTVANKQAQGGFKFKNSSVTKTYGDADFTLTATGAATGSTVTYESSNTIVATVDANGKVTILKAGSTNITATAAETADYEQATATYTLTVGKKPIAIPAADATVFTYNGTEQTYALAENGAYTITGNKQTDANETGYAVTVALKDTANTQWADGTTANKTYTFVIGKAVITVTAKNQTAYVGDKVPALGEDSYTVSGLVGDEKLTTQPTVKYVDADGNEIAPDMTKAGKTIIRASGAAASGNYTIRYEDGKLTVSTRPYSGGDSFRPNQKPTIQGSEGAKIALSADGTKLTITVEDGYEITDVLVNGVSKGAVAEITGLKTGDKVEVKTAKKTKPTNPTKPSTGKKAKLIKGVQNTTIVLKTKLTKDGKILLTWKKSKGYKVDKFEIYRSVKKNSGYGKKPFFTTKGGSRSQYPNTKKLKAGRTYYYKVRGVRIIDGKKYYTHWSNKVWRSVK